MGNVEYDKESLESKNYFYDNPNIFYANQKIADNLELLYKKIEIQRFVKEYFRILKVVLSVLRERNHDILTDQIFRKFQHICEIIVSHQANRIIMREIKASIFVCKVMFAQMDVYDPFYEGRELMVDAEEFMFNQDFIPVLIPAISNAYAGVNKAQLEDLFRAYEFMMKRVLEGINHAIEIASRGQILLDLEGTIYNTGNIFEI